MAISGLRGAVSDSLVQRFTGLAGGGSSSNLANALKGNSSEASISSGLRYGAQTFAKGVQGLNGVISFLNVGRSALEDLTSKVDEMIALADRASQSSTSFDARNGLNLEFKKLAREFQDVVEAAKFGDRELLSKESIGEVFVSLGLDPEASDTIAQVFEEFSTPGEDDSLASEEVKGARPFFVPRSAYQTASGSFLARSSTEYEEIFDGTVDLANRPNAHRMKHDLTALRDNLQTNIGAIDNAINVVGQNMDLVRAAGFAFLDLSETVSSEDDADKVANLLRQEIRRNAKGALSQADNLESIIVATLSLDLSDISSS